MSNFYVAKRELGLKVGSQQWVDRLTAAGCTIVRDERGQCPSGPIGSAYLTHPELRYVGTRVDVGFGGPYTHYIFELPSVGRLENFRGNARSVPMLQIV